MLELKVPSVGESIQEVQISRWIKQVGDSFAVGDDLVELETEKATVNIPAPVAGVMARHLKSKDEFATVGETIAMIDPKGTPDTKPATDDSSAKPANSSEVADGKTETPRVMPAAKRILEEKGISATEVTGTGPGGRILKEDARDAAEKIARQETAKSESVPSIQPPTVSSSQIQGTLEIPSPVPSPSNRISIPSGSRMEEIKPMSMLRRTIAARLVHAKQTAALLTTFNEVDMQPTMNLRNKYRDAFQERHGVKLGFMSFFTKASCEALRRFPLVNSEIRGNNIVYKNYYDIGIAIGGGKGLVVPILRNVEHMSFAEIERTIGDFAKKAMENRLQPEDLEGGTFTISNGGIYGSMLSTPIINPPQSAILGLHAIQERPVAVNGQVVVRPMMYLALTYDHRIIDGREAVTFLKTIKELVEDPARLFLEV